RRFRRLVLSSAESAKSADSPSVRLSRSRGGLRVITFACPNPPPCYSLTVLSVFASQAALPSWPRGTRRYCPRPTSSSSACATTGQAATAVIGTDAFQETPIVETARAVTKHHNLITRTKDIVRVFKEAFHIANTGRPGPVLVDVPKDLQLRKIAVDDWDPPMN